MSEQDFKHAATDAKHTQVDTTREIAEIIADLIKAALRERTGEESEKPKVEIFSSSNKVYPASEGNELSPEQVDDLLNKLANEQGSVRIYVEQNGKREKIFHQTQGEVKVDPLDLKAAMSEKLGPKLAERQQAKEEPQVDLKQEAAKEPKGIEALKALYTQDKEAFSRHFPASAKAIDKGGTDEFIHHQLVSFDTSVTPQVYDRDFAYRAYSDGVKVPESIEPLVQERQRLDESLRASTHELRASLINDAPLEQVQSALVSVQRQKMEIQKNQVNLKAATDSFVADLSQDSSLSDTYQEFVDLHKEWHPSQSWHEAIAVEQEIQSDITLNEGVSYEQSTEIPSLDHSGQPQPERELHDVGKVLEVIDNAPAPIPEKAQEKIDNAPAVYRRPTVDIEQGEQRPTVEQPEQQKVSAEITPSQGDRDQLNYPQETQSQTSNIDPAIQAAKAEFDRKLSEFQTNLDHFQNQVQKLSEQVAPLINDPNLKRWTQQASEQHRQAVQPLRDQLSTIRQTVYDRLKSAGQALDTLGRKATEKLSDLQAKAIDKSVTWLVNSRYGKDTGRGGRVFEGDKQTFKKIGNNVIISRNSDKAELYSNGRYTKSANTQDKKAIAALPNKVVDLRQKLEQKQSQSQTQQKSAGRGR